MVFVMNLDWYRSKSIYRSRAFTTEWHVRLLTVPLNSLSDKEWIRSRHIGPFSNVLFSIVVFLLQTYWEQIIRNNNFQIKKNDHIFHIIVHMFKGYRESTLEGHFKWRLWRIEKNNKFNLKATHLFCSYFFGTPRGIVSTLYIYVYQVW